jgi:hypothetical protein
VTKDHALALQRGDEVHLGSCLTKFGPRGGVKFFQEVWRVSGKPQPRPRAGDWYVPIKFGLRASGGIREDNVHIFHLDSECSIASKANTA